MRTVDTLPEFLREYCSSQDMNQYSERDHAAWRYILRRGLPFYRRHAVWVYEDGLAKTGLNTERIPDIDVMDEKLQQWGWGAVPVCGFIPPWAFLEFQARCILPIATDMRTVEHIGYTPAPDIVHEAAGHAPIIPDADYAAYLSSYAKIGNKAIYSGQDNKMYEAIRALSDIKEKPDSTPDQIAFAERQLAQAQQDYTFVSEQVKIARMSWWTAEYGLVGSLEDPKIYGAGLLSSVEESKNLYSDAVRKIRFSIACTEQGYDITKPQPQLFVAENMQHLVDVIGELSGTMAVNRGGTYALETALEAEAITTLEFDQRLQISGRLASATSSQQQIEFLKWQGPVQLGIGGQQINGQGRDRHPEGFSTPVGTLTGCSQPMHLLNQSELARLGITTGQACEFSFTSGIAVKAHCQSIQFDQNGYAAVLVLTDCTIRRGEQFLYQPDWGPCDMPLIGQLTSAFGGPCDRASFGEVELPQIDSNPSRETPFSDQEKALFALHNSIRQLRRNNSNAINHNDVQDLYTTVVRDHAEDWLIMLELHELASHKAARDPAGKQLLSDIKARLDEFSKDPNKASLVQEGLPVYSIPTVSPAV